MKNNFVKISIILPTYNNVKDIKKCLDSILAQEKHVFEIIIINDGSTDGTDEIIKGYEQKTQKLKTITTKNLGVSSARNTGITLSKGEYITFVDADDYLKPGALQKLQDIIWNNDRPDFIRYNFEEFGGKRFSNRLHDLANTVISSSNRKKVNAHLLYSEKSIPNLCQLLVIKAEIAKKIKFNEKIKYLEDQVFYQDLLNNSNVGYFSSYIGYCLKTTNESSSTKPSNVKTNIQSLIYVNKLLRNRRDIDIEKLTAAHYNLLIGKLIQLFECNKSDAYILSADENIRKFSKMISSDKNQKNTMRITAWFVASGNGKYVIIYRNIRRKIMNAIRSII